MTATKLGEALMDAGIHPRDVAADLAIAKYLNSGGTIEGFQNRINVAAARMPGMGHSSIAGNGQIACAQTRQPVEDGGAKSCVPQGLDKIAPSSSSNRGGEGLNVGVPSDQQMSALPVREPKPQRAPIDFGAASVAVKTKLAWSVLNNKYKTSDGHAWGDIGAHELDGMSRDGVLAQAIKSHIGELSNSQRFKTVSELVNAETFEAIRREVYGA